MFRHFVNKRWGEERGEKGDSGVWGGGVPSIPIMHLKQTEGQKDRPQSIEGSIFKNMRKKKKKGGKARGEDTFFKL